MATGRTEAGFREVLEFERRWRPSGVPKEAEIRRRLAISAGRYYQLLDRALDDPESLRREPVLVGRLLRLRESRRERRFAARAGSRGG